MINEMLFTSYSVEMNVVFLIPGIMLQYLSIVKILESIPMYYLKKN